MYITREQAIEVLCTVGNSQILDRKLGKSLVEIADILHHEETEGIILWGAEDDARIKPIERLDGKYSLEGRIYDALLHADAGLKTHDLARLIAEKIMAEPGVDNAD